MGDNQIDDLCPICKGSGEGWMLSDNGPDAHNIQVDCQDCNGRGSLIGAYESMKTQLASMNERYTKAGGDLFFIGIERDNLRSEVQCLTADNASLRGSCAKLGAEHAGMVRTVRKQATELDGLRKESRKWKGIERTMVKLQSGKTIATIWSACSRILISLTDELKSVRSVITEEGVTKKDVEIGDWRVTVERIDSGKSESSISP